MKNILTLPAPKLGFRTLLLLSFMALQNACMTPLISLYDAETFKDAADLKSSCLVLMDHAATDQFSEHSKEVDQVMASAWGLYERQKIRRQNKLTIRQWQLLMDDNAQPGTKAILPPFFERWKKEGKVGAVYLEEKKKNVAAAFDEILKLEGAKLRNEGE